LFGNSDQQTMQAKTTLSSTFKTANTESKEDLEKEMLHELQNHQGTSKWGQEKSPGNGFTKHSWG